MNAIRYDYFDGLFYVLGYFLQEESGSPTALQENCLYREREAH